MNADQIPANAVWHGQCKQWWTGEQRSHCGACHITLSSLTAFEIHRRGLRCNPPETVGLVARQAKFGTYWGQPGPDPDRAELRAGRRDAEQETEQ
jgi:hypothetical protein